MAAAPPPHAAPQARVARVSVEKQVVDLVFIPYANRFFVLATQTGKSGTVIEAARDAQGPVDMRSETFTVRVLLGSRSEPLLSLCARQLIESVTRSGRGASSVLLAVALLKENRDRPTFIKELLAAIAQQAWW